MTTSLAYSLNDFLKLACISRTKAYEEINAGRLRVRKNGSRTIVLASDANDWLQSLPSLEPKAAA